MEKRESFENDLKESENEKVRKPWKKSWKKTAKEVVLNWSSEDSKTKLNEMSPQTTTSLT